MTTNQKHRIGEKLKDLLFCFNISVNENRYSGITFYTEDNKVITRENTQGLPRILTDCIEAYREYWEYNFLIVTVAPGEKIKSYE